MTHIYVLLVGNQKDVSMEGRNESMFVRHVGFIMVSFFAVEAIKNSRPYVLFTYVDGIQ